MSFHDILCQDKPIQILQRAYAAGRWPHAYLFAGPEGVGKFRTAQAWAKLLLCEEPVRPSTPAGTRYDGCGQCRSCAALEAGTHPDFSHVYKELKEFTEEGRGKGPPVDLPIDVIREFLIARAGVRPALSGRRVFVVSEAEKLTSGAQNALLKVLEEPPATCSIVLLCTRLDKLLPTIRSRAQILRFGPIDRPVLAERLTGLGLDGQTARYLAALAQGSLGRALSLGAIQLEGVDLVAAKTDLVKALAEGSLADALALAETCVDRAKAIAGAWSGIDRNTSKSDLHRRAVGLVLWMFVLALEDAMKWTLVPRGSMANADQQTQIERLARRLGPTRAVEQIADGFEALRWIEANVQERLVFERLLLRILSPGIILGL